MPFLFPVGGSGTGSPPSRGWYLAASVDLGGDGGALADGDTMTAGGLTLTRRSTGASVVLTQVAGGVEVTYSGSSSAWWVLGVPAEDIAADFAADEPVIVACVASGTPGGTNSNVIGAAMWEESAGTVSRIWAGGKRSGDLYATTRSALGTAVESRTAVLATDASYVVGGYCVRRIGATALYSGSGTPPADFAATSGVYDTQVRWTATPSFTPTTLGLIGFVGAAQTVTVSRLLVYRRSGAGAA